MKAILTSLCFVICSCSSLVKETSSVKNNIVNIRTTAYHSNESDHIKYGNRSAMGTVLKEGVIAADLSVFPVGTKLKIDDKVYEVQDYGSALVKPEGVVPTVDIYTRNRREMNNWGVRFFEDVQVVQWGSYEESKKLLSDRLKYKHCRIMYDRISKKI